MLTAAQRDELDTTGITYLRGAVHREATEEMVDRIWEFYDARGVRRDDQSTWPTEGFQSKLQRLHRAGVFAAFDTEAVRGAATDVLGSWSPSGTWGNALFSFPTPGPWQLPEKVWHFDLHAAGDPIRPTALRLFGFVNDVGVHGGGTLVVEGSHELVRRRVAAAANHDAGSSAQVKKRLARDYEFFRAPTERRTEIEGVCVRVTELTGTAGDVALMLPWTMHNISMNCSHQPRFMVTHTLKRTA